MDPNCPILQKRKDFSGDITKSCEGVMSIDECERMFKTMKNKKTLEQMGDPRVLPLFLELLGSFMVSSFNDAFNHGIISLIRKEKKNTRCAKNWGLLSLLNVDYKIETKAIVLRLKILPTVILPCQSR